MARRKTDEATSLLLGEAVSRSTEAGADRAPSLERRRFYAVRIRVMVLGLGLGLALTS